ncbi:sugar transferase [Geomonas propionica]|uniref:Sugar transferase n=1 Tax=Geomonas propionica TaxID=2798582 RepID=A0ABS0YVG2_9BACT|nr:sugar transferase [Geomonas propionica]MBJ6801944.1 sugar transferase [Geomonas propionica]
MLAKRLFDLFWAVPGLIVLSPLFLVLALWIKRDSSGPVFFRQVRVGRGGRHFSIYKFRTMCSDAEAKGRQITVGADPRITRSGSFLRKYKLDELPQLINVVLGDMSLVGPRPEVPRYVELYPERVRELVLSVPPGITDYASLEYRDENAILGRSPDPERAYIEEVMPAKLRYCERYVSERSLWVDLKLILATLYAVAARR